MRRRSHVIDEVDYRNPRETGRPPISFVAATKPIAMCRCGHPEPKPRTRNQIAKCNACADKDRWGA